MNLVIAILVLILVGAACVLTGIYLLVGLPWTLIAAGAWLFVAAAFLRRGMTHG